MTVRTDEPRYETTEGPAQPGRAAHWRRTASGDVPRTTLLPDKSLWLVGCLLFWMCLLFAGPAHEDATYAIGPDIPYRYYEDTRAALSLEDFLALPDAALTEARQPLSKGYTRSAYWMRYHVPAEAFAEGELWLKLSPNYVDHITLHMRPGADPGPWHERQAGDRAGVGRGDVDYRYTVLRLPLPAEGQGLDIVMRLRTTSAMMSEPTLWQPAAFAAQAASDTAFWSFYFGIGALSSALALLLALGLKTRLLWSTIPFSLTYLLVACIQGYVGWGDAQWRLTLQHYLTGGLSLLGYPALLWMCTEALEIRLHFPRVYRVLVVSFVFGLFFPLSIPLDLYGETISLFIVLGFANALVLAVCSVRLWWRRGLSHLNLAFGILPMFYIVSGLLAIMITTATIEYAPRIYTLWQSSMMVIMMATMLLVMTVAVHRIRQEQRIHREREQLAQALRLEREASFNQRQFMGMVSHEFRTPLAVIAGALENLRAIPTPDARVSLRHDKIQRATQRLVQLTDNCLADARLSAGELYLDRQPVALMPQIDYAASLVELVDSHRLRISLDGRPVDAQAPQPAVADAGGAGPAVDGDTEAPPVRLSADAALLRIALSNLLDNAVKHTPSGDIRVDVRTGDNRVVIGIEDQGPGIPPEQAQQVFERYRGGGRPDRGGRTGSGLGLFVARQIARAHGGELALVANTPHGCRFELTLPTLPKAS